jgi:hypothetical protein
LSGRILPEPFRAQPSVSAATEEGAAPPTIVIAAKAGIQYSPAPQDIADVSVYWIPACAGMTDFCFARACYRFIWSLKK